MARHRTVRDLPCCIYCGGPNETVDHVPPKGMFDNKDRPKGLEFPSCLACNNGTKDTDAVIALLARIYPDAATDTALADLQKYGGGVSRNFPDILLEMQVSRTSERRAMGEEKVAAVAAGLMNVGGPLVKAHLERFGTKFGFAMHYLATGERVPDGGAVGSVYFTNMSVLDGTFPADALDYFGAPKTLTQGAKGVGSQFQYNYAKATDQGSVAFAALRASFSFFTFSADDVGKLKTALDAGGKVFPPGSLKVPVASTFPRIRGVFAGGGFRWAKRQWGPGSPDKG